MERSLLNPYDVSGSLTSLCTSLHKNQYEENQNRNAAPANVPVRRDMPAGLLRRYEVNIIPSFSERARKIREIKAVGKECNPHVINSLQVSHR